MDPVLEPFEEIAGEINFQTPKLPLICNVTGKLMSADTQLTGKYWADHIRAAVRYADSINAAEEFGCEVMLELGPQSVLTRMAAANWQQGTDRLISCLQRDQDEAASIKAAIAGLYSQGITPNFEAIYQPTSSRDQKLRGRKPKRIVLPTYPFQRRRFWGPDKPRAAHAQHHTAHPSLGEAVSLAGTSNESRFESFVEPDSPPWLPDHEVMGQVVMPGAAFVELALAATEMAQLHDVKFEQPLRPTARTAMQTVIKTDAEKNRVIETFSCPAESSAWTRHFTATTSPASPTVAATDEALVKDEPKLTLEQIRSQPSETVSAESFYAGMSELGLNYGPNFQTIQTLNVNESGVLATLATQADIRGYIIPPPLLDGAIHSLAVGLLKEDGDSLFLPVGMKRVRLLAEVKEELICYAKWTQPDGELRTADLTLMDTDGNVVGEIQSLQVRQTSRSALRQLSGSGSARLLYEMQWQNFRLPAPSETKRNWLIVGDRKGVAKRLTEAGHEVQSVELKDSDDALVNWDEVIDAETAPAGILWDFTSDTGDDTSTHDHCTAILSLAKTLAEKNIRKIECGLQLLTSNAVDISGADVEGAAVDPNQAKYLGLGRVLGAEQPEFRCRLIDADTFSEETDAALFEFLVTETKESQFAIRGGQFQVPRLKQVKLPKVRCEFHRLR